MMAESTFLRNVPCPACDSSRAGAEYDDGTGRCHKCGHRWTLGEEFEQKWEARRVTNEYQFVTPEAVDLPQRRLLRTTLEKWRYGIADTYRGKAHVAQFYGKTGILKAQKYRGHNKEFWWTGDHSDIGLWGSWLWAGGGKILVVTEGELDALSVSQVQENRWPVASLPDGAGSAEKAVKLDLGWVESFERVVLMFDEDEEGKRAVERAAMVLSPGKAFVASLPLKDASAMLQAGREAELRQAIWNAHPFRPDGIMSWDDLRTRLTVRRERVASFPFKELDEKVKGLQRGEIWVICAGIHAGKSTLCRCLINSFVDQGLRVGVLPLEESVEEYLKGVVGMRAGKNYRFLEEDPTEDSKFWEAFDSLRGKVEVYDDQGTQQETDVFKIIRHLSVAGGCDVILVDHLTLVIGGSREGDDRRYADRLMTNLTSMVKRTGAIVFVVMHLKKVGDGVAHEDGRAITMTDIRGSGLIPALSHGILAYERDQQSEQSLGRFRVLKRRGVGLLGGAGRVIYDYDTGRLTGYRL